MPAFGGMLTDAILEEEQLPLLLAGLSLAVLSLAGQWSEVRVGARAGCAAGGRS